MRQPELKTIRIMCIDDEEMEVVIHVPIDVYNSLSSECLLNWIQTHNPSIISMCL